MLTQDISFYVITCEASVETFWLSFHTAFPSSRLTIIAESRCEYCRSPSPQCNVIKTGRATSPGIAYSKAMSLATATPGTACIFESDVLIKPDIASTLATVDRQFDLIDLYTPKDAYKRPAAIGWSSTSIGEQQTGTQGIIFSDRALQVTASVMSQAVRLNPARAVADCVIFGVAKQQGWTVLMYHQSLLAHGLEQPDPVHDGYMVETWR